jgi:hypothetical protein
VLGKNAFYAAAIARISEQIAMEPLPYRRCLLAVHH